MDLRLSLVNQLLKWSTIANFTAHMLCVRVRVQELGAHPALGMSQVASVSALPEVSETGAHGLCSEDNNPPMSTGLLGGASALI